MFGSQEESTARTHNRLAEGQVFEGRFQILSILGEGGVGVVYKAKHLHMDKTVAIKTLASAMVSDDTSFLRFQQEAKAASSLAHANIIIIHDFGRTADGLAFLVMEYLGNKSLDDLLKGQHQLDLDTFLRIFTQICDGLQHAHKKGIVHRDLKPSNIMLVDDEETANLVKIVDFGLAKLLSAVDSQQHLTQTGAVLGTPLYMSPEQCRGRQLDHRADIYAVGCMMYSALTGRVPHQGETALNTLMKHMMEPPAPFAVSAPNLVSPPPLEAVIFKALQKDPDLRQQSMAELKTDITNAIYFRHPQVAIPAPALPEYADRRTTLGHNGSVQMPPSHPFNANDEDKTRVTDPALGHNIQAPLQARSKQSAAPDLQLSQPVNPPAHHSPPVQPASPLTGDSRVARSPAVQKPANAGAPSLRQGAAASSATASTGRIVLISVLATCACLIPATLGFLFFINQKQSAPGPATIVTNSAPSTAAVGSASTEPHTNQETPHPAAGKGVPADKTNTVAIVPSQQHNPPAPPKVVASTGAHATPPKVPKIAIAPVEHVRLPHANASEAAKNAAKQKQMQLAEAHKSSDQLFFQGNQAFSQQDYATAYRHYQQCRDYEHRWGAGPRMLLLDAYMIDCILRQNPNQASDQLQQHLVEALRDFGKDRNAVTTPNQDARVWRPLARASLLTADFTQDRNYYVWAAEFGKIAIDRWTGPRSGPLFTEIARTCTDALQHIDPNAAARKRKELGLPEPQKPAPKPRAKHWVKTRKGKMVIQELR